MNARIFTAVVWESFSLCQVVLFVCKNRTKFGVYKVFLSCNRTYIVDVSAEILTLLSVNMNIRAVDI